MSNTTIVFNADAANFLANMAAMKQSLLANGDAVSMAKAKIVTALQEQTEAALKAGKSQQELDRIQSRGAERLAQVTEQNAARTSAALDRLLAKQRAVAAEMERLGRITVPQSHGGFTDRMAASSVVRGLEGNSGIRSIENFATMIPGFSAAAQTLAPIIGGVGLAGLFVELGEKAFEAYKKLKMVPEAISEGWEGLSEPIELEADSLRKANAELDITIAHFEHKPANELALEVAETRIEIDKLAASALKASAEVKKLLEENRVGAWDNIFTGAIGTGPEEDEINKRMKARQKAALDLKDDQRSGKLSPDEYRKRKDALRQSDLDNAAFFAKERRDLESFNQGGNLDGAVNDVVGAQTYFENQADLSDQSSQNIAKQKIGKTLQDKSKLSKDAAEEQRKKDEAQRKQWEQQDAQRNVAGTDSPIVEVNTWAQRVAAQKIGSDQYIYALKELSEKLSEARRQDAEQQKKAATDAEKAERDRWTLMHDTFVSTGRRSAQDEMDFWAIRVLEAKEGTENYKQAYTEFSRWMVAAQKEAADAQSREEKKKLADAHNAGRLADAGLKLKEKQGTISPYDAAVQQANINSQVAAAEMAALKEEREKAAKNYGTNSKEFADADLAVQKASVDRQIQIQEDAARIVGETWQGALKNSLAVWVQDATDAAKAVQQITGNVINDANAALLKDITSKNRNDRRYVWRDAGKSMFTDVAGAALKSGEGEILKAFGLGKTGKPDGTSGNPIHVIIAGGLLGGGGNFADAAKNSADKFFGGSGSGGDGSAGSTTSTFVGKTLGFFGSLFGGGLALGGDVQPGVAYDVGEMGRERFIPKTAGTIVPNSQLGGGGHTFNIDARGSTDPAQTMAIFRRGFAEMAPHLIAASVHATSETQRRTPASRRTP